MMALTVVTVTARPDHATAEVGRVPGGEVRDQVHLHPGDND